MKDNPNKKEKIIEKYNSTAHFYDARYSKIQAEKFKHVLKDYNIEGKIILDAGCGTGLFQEYIQNNLKFKKKSSFSFLATDISLKMLTKLLLKIKKGKIQFENKIHLVLSDMEHLPFREGVFNTIFSLTSLQNLSSISKGVKESLYAAINGAEIRFSILKKSLDLDALIHTIKPNIEHLKIIRMDELEDIILYFNLHKN